MLTPVLSWGRTVVDAGQKVTCAPGPSAVLTALVLAGLPTDAFFFAGFLPTASAARCKTLEGLTDIPGTLIFYESPKRLSSMLADASETLGAARKAVVCRELTKKFEEVRRGTLEELAGAYEDQSVKGEIVVLIDRNRVEKISEASLGADIRDALAKHSLRDAVDIVAQSHNVARRQVYQMALALSKD